MKAALCDFCKAVVETESPAAMLFQVVIEAAEDFEAKLKVERAVLFDAEHCCLDCAVLVREALRRIKKERSKP